MAGQKAQIALEILKEEKSINQIASAYGVHPNVLYRLKKQVLENLPGCSRRAVRASGIASWNMSARWASCKVKSAA